MVGRWWRGAVVEGVLVVLWALDQVTDGAVDPRAVLPVSDDLSRGSAVRH